VLEQKKSSCGLRYQAPSWNRNCKQQVRNGKNRQSVSTFGLATASRIKAEQSHAPCTSRHAFKKESNHPQKP